MKTIKKIIAFALAIIALASCDKINNGGEQGGDWYGGGITGDYETFTVEINAAEDWITPAEMLINNWYTFSPTKGKAGTQLITFRVKTKNIIGDGGTEIHSVESDDDEQNTWCWVSFYSHSPASGFTMEFNGRPITKVDVSNFPSLKRIEFYQTPRNLKEIWLKEGQDIEFYYDGGNPTWEVKYK